MHGGGYLGGYYGRIDHVWGARSDAHADLPKPPTSYLKQIYFDTVVFSHGQLEALVKTFGPDHVVMGTDYPFDMADYDPVGHVASIAAFDSATVGKIVGGNTKRILGPVRFAAPRLERHELDRQFSPDHLGRRALWRRRSPTRTSSARR